MNSQFDLLEIILSDMNPLSMSKKQGLRTGFSDLDDFIGGLSKGDFIVVGGRPAMGKTALALNIINNITKYESLPCIYVSLEDTKEQLIKRLISINSKIPLRAFEDGTIVNENKVVTQTIEKLREKQIYIRDDPTITIKKLSVRCKEIAEKSDIGLIIIEGYEKGLLKKDKNSKQSVPGLLKKLALELNVPIMLFSNISRSVDCREDHRPTLSDLICSKDYSQFVDIIMFLYRDDYYCPEQSKTSGSIAQIDIAYQRCNRPVGCVELKWQEEYNIYNDINL